ncbi:MAG TPA: YqgE/AlgH family protein [Burkholderiaceae bacterium]|nr:YqgE/AlgH family protein [Burkholderiaceae bacterium]
MLPALMAVWSWRERFRPGSQRQRELTSRDWFVLALAVLIALVVFGPRARAGELQAGRSQLRGVETAGPGGKLPLLAASGQLEHTAWGRTVILVTPLGQGAHLGIIVNRPTGSRLGQLFPEHAPSQKVPEPVYFGGPMSPNAIIALIQTQASPGTRAMAIAPGVYLAVDAPTIDRVIEQQADHARFFVGFIMWGPRELEEQVDAGVWTLREVEPATVFRKNTESLWRELAAEPDTVRSDPARELPGMRRLGWRPALDGPSSVGGPAMAGHRLSRQP